MHHSHSLAMLPRASKFRHLYGETSKRENSFENVRIASTIGADGSFIRAGLECFALPFAAEGGGRLLVWPYTHTGRLPHAQNLHFIIGHATPITDFDISPFDDRVIASGSTDRIALVWKLPQISLSEDLTEPQMALIGHCRRVNVLSFHPTASDVLLTADTLPRLWNLQSSTQVVELEEHGDLVMSTSFSHDGNLIATSSRDKKLRVFDPRAYGRTRVAFRDAAHEGAKGFRTLWLGESDRLLSVGHSKASERQVRIWDIRNGLRDPLATEVIDIAPGLVIPWFDADTNILYLAGKGDSTIRFFELVPDAPYIHFLNEYRSSSPQNGLSPLPKRCVDVKVGEVVRFLRLTRNTLETVSIRVPRKNAATVFQDDIFPPAFAGVPSVDARAWFWGQGAPPRVVSLHPEGMNTLNKDKPPVKKEGNERRIDVDSSSHDTAWHPSGYLHQRKGSKISGYSKLWYSVEGASLFAFKDPDSPKSHTRIPLCSITSVERCENPLKFKVQTNDGGLLKFLAASRAEREKWMGVLRPPQLPSPPPPSLKVVEGGAPLPPQSAQTVPVSGREKAASQILRIMEDGGSPLHPKLDRPDMEGHLLKRGKKTRAWVRRWFELRGRELFCYSSKSEARKSYHLDKVLAVERKSGAFEFCLVTLTRKIGLRAPSAQEREAWVAMLAALVHKADPGSPSAARASHMKTCVLEGYLMRLELSKTGRVGVGIVRGWKRRWVCLLSDQLALCTAPDTSANPEEVILLNTITACHESINLIGLPTQDLENCFQIGTGKGDVTHLLAETLENRMLWQEAIDNKRLCTEDWFTHFGVAFPEEEERETHAVEVMGVDEDILEDDLTSLFDAFGEITKVEAGRQGGLTIQYARKESAESALGLHRSKICGSEVSVSLVEQKREKLRSVVDSIDEERVVDPADLRSGKCVRLYSLRGRRNVRAVQVECLSSSFRQGDVLLLDAGRVVYQWNGALSSRYKRAKGLDITTAISRQERGGRAALVVLDVDSGDEEAPFWQLLGGKPDCIAPSGSDDGTEEQELDARYRLFRISNEGSRTERIRLVLQKQRPPKEILQSNYAYVLDCGVEIFVWYGMKATMAQRQLSVAIAKRLHRIENRPSWASITRVGENRETFLFKDQFLNFAGMLPISTSRYRMKKSRIAASKQQPKIDVLAMHQTHPPPLGDPLENIPLNGTIKIWHIDDFEKHTHPSELYGQFCSSLSYVILYSYENKLKRSGESHVIFFWQGRDCSTLDRGTSAMLTIMLTDEVGADALQIRVIQQKEPMSLLRVLRNPIVIWKGVLDQPNALLEVAQGVDMQCRAVEVDSVADVVSGDKCYVLCAPSTVTVWNGAGSVDAERIYADNVARWLARRRSIKDIVSLMNGDKDETFWHALKGGGVWNPVSQTHRRPLRLFEFSAATGVVEVEETFPFTQDDLNSFSVMMLDAYHTVFVWFGRESSYEEQKMSIDVAQEYVQRASDERPTNDTVFVVWDLREPREFTTVFPAWSSVRADKDRKRLGLLKAERRLFSLRELWDEYHRTVYSYEELLKDPLPKGIDPTQLESYLPDQEFERLFGMTRAEYARLPGWRRDPLRKAVYLF